VRILTAFGKPANCTGDASRPTRPEASNDLHAHNYPVQLPAADTFRREFAGFTFTGCWALRPGRRPTGDGEQ